jgi:hypothetical protein
MVVKWLIVSVGLGSLPLLLELLIGFGDTSVGNKGFVQMWALKGELLLVAVALSAALLANVTTAPANVGAAAAASDSETDNPHRSPIPTPGTWKTGTPSIVKAGRLARQVALWLCIGLAVAATFLYAFVESTYQEAQATALEVISTQKPKSSEAVCLLDWMKTDVDSVRVTDVYKDENTADVKPRVLLQAYDCNNQSVRYFMSLVLVTYGAAAMVGLVVFIVDGGRGSHVGNTPRPD